MMHGPTRMSPLTALFLGLFGVGAVGITSGTAIVLYGMTIVDTKAASLVDFADGSIGSLIESLPELLESLPPTLQDMVNDRRAPDYATSVDITTNFVTDTRRGGLRPVLTIINKGDEVISLLAVRVAALTESGVPIGEWTEVVATPLAIDRDWRGLLMPGATRHVVMSGWSQLSGDLAKTITGEVEISEIRLWEPSDERT